MITVNSTDRSKILELINQAPGDYFSLSGSSQTPYKVRNYKGKRQDFFEKLTAHLNSELSTDGFYQVKNGTNTKVNPLFIIQKGSGSATTSPIIIQEKESSDISLVKENAELKAKLHYLELQLAELQEQLEDSEKELSEAPDPAEKPNPWLSLAEQLAPAAAQIIGALAAKIISPSNEQSIGTRNAQSQPVEVRYPRTDAQFNPGTIPGQRSDRSNDLQGNDHPGTEFRNIYSPSENPF
jgi:hypothetical protein